jgi:hypothetical protein
MHFYYFQLLSIKNDICNLLLFEMGINGKEGAFNWRLLSGSL